MDKEELHKYISNIFKAYQSIPKDALINSITGKSSLVENSTKKFEDTLHIPYGMVKIRKEGDVSASFIPVYSYETKNIGMYVSYYNTKMSKSWKVGPFYTADEFANMLYQIKDSSAYTYISSALKIDSGFINSYDNVYKQFNNKISLLPTLPLMNIEEKDSFLGPSLTVLTHYVNNPYAYSDVMIEEIKIDGFSGCVTVHYRNILGANEVKLWNKFEKNKIKDVLTASVMKIKETRMREDEIIKLVKRLK